MTMAYLQYDKSILTMDSMRKPIFARWASLWTYSNTQKEALSDPELKCLRSSPIIFSLFFSWSFRWKGRRDIGNSHLCSRPSYTRTCSWPVFTFIFHWVQSKPNLTPYSFNRSTAVSQISHWIFLGDADMLVDMTKEKEEVTSELLYAYMLCNKNIWTIKE